MTEELERKLDEEKRDHLVNRINQLYEEGVLRVRDWLAMYDIMLEACERERADTMEQMLINCMEDGDSGD